MPDSTALRSIFRAAAISFRRTDSWKEGVMKQKIDAVRAYVGINDQGEQTLMLVGTRLNLKTGIYEDVFPKAVNNEAAKEAEIVYDGVRTCPPYGDPNSPMNI